MKKLKFDSYLIGNRYSKDFYLPDFCRTEDDIFSREATLEKIMKEEYGIFDDSGIRISVEEHCDYSFATSNGYFCAGKAKYTTLTFSLERGNIQASFDVDLFVPTKKNSGKTVVQIDFGKTLPTKYCPTEELMDMGLTLAHIYYNEVTTDNGDFTTGIAKFVDRSLPYAPGKITLWSYAMRITAKYLVEKGYASKDAIYTAGHSRLGKTSLIACACDEIFTGCFVNCAGVCGPAISREKHGDSIALTFEVFPYWYTKEILAYADRENELPFDQHFLIACVAPRTVCVVAGTEDYSADTDAQYIACQAGSVAYGELGVYGLEKRILNDGDMTTVGNIKFYKRIGGHFFCRDDWHFYAKCIDIL